MARRSHKVVDAADREHREIGAGLLDEEMGPGSSLAHLYRGEVHRMRFWRERLDRTTHWAIVVVSALLTWTFASPDNPHYVLLLGAAAVTAFLVIEARRFRGYDLWRGRVRALQRNVFAYGLDPAAGVADPAWRRELSDDYRAPAVKIGVEESIAHRLRRVYLLVYAIVFGGWAIRVLAFADRPWPASAAVGEVPGTVVTGAVAVFSLAALAVAVRPREWHVEDEIRTTAVGRHRDAE